MHMHEDLCTVREECRIMVHGLYRLYTHADTHAHSTTFFRFGTYYNMALLSSFLGTAHRAVSWCTVMHRVCTRQQTQIGEAKKELQDLKQVFKDQSAEFASQIQVQ